jgi:hypothetical protein
VRGKNSASQSRLGKDETDLAARNHPDTDNFFIVVKPHGSVPGEKFADHRR